MTKRELILLALDKSQSLQLMERALQAVDYEVAAAHDRKGLESALEESSPALLLLGEHFDGQNGIEIAKVQLERFPTLPILLFAEKDTTGTIKAVLKTGLIGYLYTQLHTEDIVHTVKESLAPTGHFGAWLRRAVKSTTSSLHKRPPNSSQEHH